jgi:hypothetical protein
MELGEVAWWREVEHVYRVLIDGRLWKIAGFRVIRP